MLPGFEERHAQFEKDFENTKKAAMIGAIITIVLWLGSVAFAIWVILKVMAHFGII